MSLKRLLWVGDAGCNSGFGKATRCILRNMRERWDIAVLGVNYNGDPHDEPYPIWPALPGGDPIGLKRIQHLIPKLKPELIVLQTNPWNVPRYRVPKGLPTVGIIAVEGKNCTGTDLNSLTQAIFWTEFGRKEAVQGGMTCSSSVIPLGVDLDIYKPDDAVKARKALGLPEKCWDAFIVGNVNRNQNRKRLDLSIQYFAKWYHAAKPNAYLFLHVLPGSSVQCDCDQLAKYYGVQDRLILVEPTDIFQGVPERWVVTTMQTFDVGLSTALGEGFGLTAIEMLACGVPVIAGDYAAIGEWGRDAVYLIPCPMEGLMPDVWTMIGGIPDGDKTIEALNLLYESPTMRATYRAAGLKLVAQPQYRWESIATRFATELETACQTYP